MFFIIYIQSQKKELEKFSNDIITLAINHKIVLDINIVEKTLKEKKKNYDREMKETIKFVKRLIYPSMDLKIHHNARFSTNNLLDVLVHVGLTHDFTNNGSNTFRIFNSEKDSPSGDLMMHHFSKFKSADEIQGIFDKVLSFIFTYVKKNYNLLNKRSFDIAYDIHKVPYYGKPMQYVLGGEQDRGTNNFFEFLTCSIVVSGKRFILDVIPIHPFDRLENLVDKSLFKIRDKIKIKIAYILMDRGFDRAKIIDVLNKHKIKFLMPKIKSSTVKVWFDKSEAIESRIIHNFQIGIGKDKVFVNLILVDNEKGVKQAFMSNFDIALTMSMLINAFNQNYDIGILFAGDADYLELVKEVKRYGPKIYGCFFENGLSRELKLSFDKFKLLTIGNIPDYLREM